MDYASELGFDLKLLYYIKMLEEIVMFDDGITIMSDLWHTSYEINSWVVREKEAIFRSIAERFINEYPENANEVIEGVRLLFEYLDAKMVINKLTDPNNPESDAKDKFKYHPEYLKNPRFALEELTYQILALAC